MKQCSTRPREGGRSGHNYRGLSPATRGSLHPSLCFPVNMLPLKPEGGNAPRMQAFLIKTICVLFPMVPCDLGARLDSIPAFRKLDPLGKTEMIKTWPLLGTWNSLSPLLICRGETLLLSSCQVCGILTRESKVLSQNAP